MAHRPGKVRAFSRGPVWRGHFLALRNRILSSPRFQRWAAAFPLTRPVAHHRARRMFDIVAGFVYSQVLYACVHLRIIELLHESGPLTIEELAARVDLPEESCLLLAKAAASLELMEYYGRGRWGLGRQGAAMIANPGVAAMVEHHVMLYEDLQDPVALLRAGKNGQTRLGRFWAYAGQEPPGGLDGGRVDEYTRLMSVSQQLVAEEILDAFTPRGYTRLMDLGGGNATFLSAVAGRLPDLELVLFDLPAVAEKARTRFAELGLAHRATAIGGDFFSDPLPRGADLISLVRVVHDHNDNHILGLFRSIREALPDHGALLLAEPMSGTSGAEPMGDAYFGMYLFAMGRGRPRTPSELEEMLFKSGFTRVRLIPTRTPLLTRVMLAQP
ncbi:acetylserotonin O-methyltransferase [Ectothiorhodospira lacustris]|uniref:acetylserotonin O-methyltransferase n=1 Tax=Ectothiorhodospira lacustris TaxID=2899127 RepID=UPI001EE80093|nr:acetylserotonin O-methyltransferase [Ectothiorhodospira lacustris]MCG5501757.1 acetylserotonin O-methyltransferase [Ectothiorhodospira lacustris]MCG5511169.1 acetylserotonin O-methyltransferase [Ectothiorhodospira lacustris]MCG5522833.1 acetylserotonin O-methyltransferase [Ectothiorhodospira lacustris]